MSTVTIAQTVSTKQQDSFAAIISNGSTFTDALSQLMAVSHCPTKHRRFLDALISVYNECKTSGDFPDIKTMDGKLTARYKGDESAACNWDALKKRVARDRAGFLEWQKQNGVDWIGYQQRKKTSTGRSLPGHYELPFLRVLAYIIKSATSNPLFRDKPGVAMKRAAYQHKKHLDAPHLRLIKAPDPAPEKPKPTKLERAEKSFKRSLATLSRAGIDPRTVTESHLEKLQSGQNCPEPNHKNQQVTPPAKTCNEQFENPIVMEELNLITSDGEILQSVNIPTGNRELAADYLQRLPEFIDSRTFLSFAPEKCNVSTITEEETLQASEEIEVTTLKTLPDHTEDLPDNQDATQSTFTVRSNLPIRNHVATARKLKCDACGSGNISSARLPHIVAFTCDACGALWNEPDPEEWMEGDRIINKQPPSDFEEIPELDDCGPVEIRIDHDLKLSEHIKGKGWIVPFFAYCEAVKHVIPPLDRSDVYEQTMTRYASETERSRLTVGDFLEVYESCRNTYSWSSNV